MVEKVFSLDMPFDLLVIDDGSPDGTGNKVKELMAEHPNRLHLIERKGKLGLGTAYITGFKWCLEKGYDYICEMDCDFSHNPEDLLRLQKACSEGGADLSVGSRYVNHMVNVVNWPMGRVLLSYFASMYVRFITRMRVMDTTAGFVCYKRKVLEKINLDKIKFKGYAFQIEMKFTAIKFGFELVEVPIIFTDRTAGESKMNKGIIREAFIGVMQLKFNSFFKNWK
ncbi:MAG: polyprenol monophosphomannose synthase [Flavobacteriales bacterium]|nr:polyprenol monophosphomannose synthase [Flavobacteriales bacterium]